MSEEIEFDQHPYAESAKDLANGVMMATVLGIVDPVTGLAEGLKIAFSEGSEAAGSDGTIPQDFEEVLVFAATMFALAIANGEDATDLVEKAILASYEDGFDSVKPAEDSDNG